MDFENSCCNPIPLPDYPQGCHAKIGEKSGWLNSGEMGDFREAADPSVIYDDGRWILYPSAGMAWVSEDFRTWKHVKMNVSDIGYAPTIVKHRGLFYLTACNAPLYRSASPLGPWEEIGPMLGQDGKPLPLYTDPMLFSDDDGRLYCYWGCGGPGILGVELDANAPNHATGEVKLLFAYDPAHVWERAGEFNEDPSRTFIEGPWMFKHGSRYFLTYCAPGTEYASYGMGCYVSKSPLGPFSYQARNPILKTTGGFIRGPGHGCIVKGPKDTIWAFYTFIACRNHMLERRIGFDPAGFDDDGNLFVNGASETPQWAPGTISNPDKGNLTGLLPVSISKFASSSSQLPGRGASCAIDNNIRTWWEAEPEDKSPFLELDFKSVFDISAMRLIWAEPHLDHKTAPPGPFKYRLEARETNKSNWTTIVDMSDNKLDLLIDYKIFPTTPAQFVRLTIQVAPKGVGIGVTDLCVFGKGRMPSPDAPYGKWPPK